MAGTLYFTHISYGRFHALVAPVIYDKEHDGKVLIAAVHTYIGIFITRLSTDLSALQRVHKA